MSTINRAPGMPAAMLSRSARFGLAFLLAPVAFFFLLFVAGFGFIIQDAMQPTGGPLRQIPAVAGMIVLAIMIMLAAFLGRITFGLGVAVLLGRNVQYLMPPIVQFILALLLGVSGVITIVVALLQGTALGVGIGHSLVFLAFAYQQARQWRGARSTTRP